MVNSLYLDITRAEEDAQRLKVQSQLLASIYDTVPCGILRFVYHNSDDCELVSLNRAAPLPLGLSKHGRRSQRLEKRRFWATCWKKIGKCFSKPQAAP